MTVSPSSFAGRISLLSTLTPPFLSRAWFSAPHPSLPLLATCSSDKSVRIYSLTSFTLLSTISGGHKRSVRTCAWKPAVKGQSVLATGSFDASVGIWSKWDDDMVPKLRGEEKDYTTGESLNGAGLDGEENGNSDEDEEWRFALVLNGHDSEVKSVAWSAGGNFIATCSRDKSVWIWEEIGEDDFETIAVMQEHQADVKSVAWHPEEELLASASYDDDVRLWKEDVDDWGCVSILRGHDSTVWAVEWEGVAIPTLGAGEHEKRTEEQDTWIERRAKAGPRLASCSDDMSIRIWQRQPRDKGAEQSKLSIIRTNSIEEDWTQEAQLPKRHERAIYSISWSKRSGRIVSSGGDGKIVVYEERWAIKDVPQIHSHDSADHSATTDTMQGVDNEKVGVGPAPTEWVVLAEIEGAHGVFEVNHICFARRADRGRRSEDEEVVVSTGDDGVVQIWSIDV